MKLDDAIASAVKEGKLPNNSYPTIVIWAVQNNIEENFKNFLSSISELAIVKDTASNLQNKPIPVNRLDRSDFLIFLANSYSGQGMHDKAIAIFEEIKKKGSNESTMLNDFGLALLKKTLAEGTVDKAKWDYARKLIFEALSFDRSTTKNFYKLPAYMNLCFLRAVEAKLYLDQNDPFAAFMVGWMSIEMTLHRIWRQYLELKKSTKLDELDRWEAEKIIEMLFIGDIDDRLPKTKAHLQTLKDQKNNFNTLRGVRNHLIHGDCDNPTNGEAKLCLDTALTIAPLFKVLDNERLVTHL
ncbi:MAG: hypothetical protein ACFCUE_08510 [Candidatus Bathyarchaeia archaeon]|jgi:tetratricopeptide (TPR) repeat protein